MNVIIDKINSAPEHSLDFSDVKFIHKFIKEKLSFNIKTYRLSNETPNKSRFDRPVHFDNISRKLTICSRNYSKAQIIKEIFIETLQQSDHSLRAASFNHLSKSQQKLADEQANIMLQEYLFYVENCNKNNDL